MQVRTMLIPMVSIYFKSQFRFRGDEHTLISVADDLSRSNKHGGQMLESKSHIHHVRIPNPATVSSSTNRSLIVMPSKPRTVVSGLSRNLFGAIFNCFEMNRKQGKIRSDLILLRT